MKRFELLRPLYPFIITQPFNWNIIDYTKICDSLGRCLIGHNGLDCVRGCIKGVCYKIEGAYVRATHDGVVYKVGGDDKGGYGVELITDEKFLDVNNQSYYFKTIYWHLQPNIPVIKNQKVKVGDIIGYADNTGMSTGPHLHFGCKPGDLVQNEFIKAFPDNNFFGCVDPKLYLSELSAYQVLNSLQLASEVIRKVVDWLLKRK